MRAPCPIMADVVISEGYLRGVCLSSEHSVVFYVYVNTVQARTHPPSFSPSRTPADRRPAKFASFHWFNNMYLD